MIFDDLQAAYPHFVKVASHLEHTSPLFMESPLRQLRESAPDYAFAEKLCRDAYALCDGQEAKVFELADTLVEFSMEFVFLQRQLEKSGRYLYASFEEVEAQVYNDPARALKGAPYMWALYFTQAFWVTHGRVWTFFLRDFAPAGTPRGTLLEVPSGNGLFTTHFLLANPGWHAVALDLSDTAIEFTQRVLSLNGVRARAEVKKEDFFRFGGGREFDRIICGEFLEHVAEPLQVLAKLRTLVREDGRVFLTAAVWAANIDHIYLYRSAQEVREHIRASGFAIEREFVQNVFANGRPEQEKTPINYSAIVRPA
jgi:2-polyprenyl-3-methyl-5-hydroxy-6-metoxy-1,4-benzoquinol methylase